MDEFTVHEPAAALDPAWPIDLTKEDNTRYYMQVSKKTGVLRLRGVLLVAMLLFTAGMAALFIYEWVALGLVDWLSIGLSVALLAASLGIWWIVPVRMRRMAERAYDEAVESGYSYAGVVRVKADRIEKESVQGTNTLLLNGRTLFMETPEMMVFTTAGRPAIVLPARYLTDEAATALRAAADKLPYRNRVFLGRVRPGGEIPTPTAVPPHTVLWEREIHYEPSEMEGIYRHAVVTRFTRNLPTQAILCVLCAVSVGLEETTIFKVVGGFLFMFAVTTALSLWLPLRRAKGMAQMADALSRTASVKLTDRGVWVSHANSGFVLLPWRVVDHVIDRDSYVEITRKKQSVRIPKRCIEDIAAFDSMITSVRKTTSSK